MHGKSLRPAFKLCPRAETLIAITKVTASSLFGSHREVQAPFFLIHGCLRHTDTESYVLLKCSRTDTGVVNKTDHLWTSKALKCNVFILYWAAVQVRFKNSLDGFSDNIFLPCTLGQKAVLTCVFPLKCVLIVIIVVCICSQWDFLRSPDTMRALLTSKVGSDVRSPPCPPLRHGGPLSSRVSLLCSDRHKRESFVWQWGPPPS